MANQATNPDSGLRAHRVEFVRESTPGVTPADPAWNLYSDTLETALVWEADAQIEAQRGVGDYSVKGHFTGPEDHTASIEYHLQQWFVDGSGNPQDAAGDALLRDADGGVRNTHTIVDRADYGDERTYVVARGAYPNLDELSGDPGTGLPLVVSLAYEAKKVRMYKVKQPDSAGEQLTVKSTSANDTTQTLTIENDGATTTDDVPLNGTTGVVTETDAASAITFSSIDALVLDAETEGDVIVEDSTGNELARIHGSSAYADGASGNLGVPALGAGSHAAELGTAYETFLDDTITQGGADLAAEVRSAGLSVDNGYEKAPLMGTTEQAVHVGLQSVEFTATVAGNFEEYASLEDHLQNKEFDIVWTFDGGSITLKNCVITAPGEVGPSAGDIVSTLDNTFEAKDLVVS